jgi:origin recognition complex subunit 2
MKRTADEAELDMNSDEHAIREHDTSDANGESSVKRKRGRPPGSKNKLRDVNGDVVDPARAPAWNEALSSSGSEIGSDLDEPTKDSTPQPAVKRGPGRPRKHPLPTEKTADEAGDSSAFGTPAPIKRGPGRPRKIPRESLQGTATPESEAAIAPKRGPGRPRKHPIERKASPAPDDAIERTLFKALTGIETVNGDNQSQDESGSDEDDEVGNILRHVTGELDEEDEAPRPTKRKPGRPKKSDKKQASPPLDFNLPSHEQYFWQNRPGKVKTSSNTLSDFPLLSHEEYFSQLRNYTDTHEPEQQHLENLHARSFPQWRFELNQGFNLCLYGWGSKLNLTKRFAHWYHEREDRPIVFVNGHLPSCSIRSILHTLTSALLGSNHNVRFPAHATEAVSTFLSIITENPSNTPILLIFNVFDAPHLRKQTFQTAMAFLASHPSISLFATTSSPSFSLMWDASLREHYNFLFHDTTTFRPHDAELGPEVVDVVHDLLGRSGRKGIAGKDGVIYVLRSLPENAQKLYRVLVTEQLSNLEDGVEEGGDGVEYRSLYHKAVEEFLCSTEMSFRTLLKE